MKNTTLLSLTDKLPLPLQREMNSKLQWNINTREITIIIAIIRTVTIVIQKIKQKALNEHVWPEQAAL